MRIKRYAFSFIVAFLIAIVALTTIASGQAQAALVFHSGFESGDFTEWATVVGSPTVQSTIKNTGSYAMRCSSSGTAAYIQGVAIAYRQSIYLYIAALPDIECAIIGGADGARVALTTDGYIKVYYTTVALITSTTPFSTGEWHRISICRDDTPYYLYLYIDGNLVGNTGSNIGNITQYTGVLTAGCTTDLYFDDAVLINNLGSADPGDIRVLRSSPIADAYHDDWKDTGGGATTWDDVDECPASTADYAWVEANGTLLQQTWTTTTTTTLGINGLTVNAISSWFYYSTGGGGGIDEYFTYMRDNGTDYSTSVDDPKNGGFWVGRYDAVMPNGGGVWTEARVNAYEIGMATDDANKDMWCYTAYKMIAYTAAAAGEADISNIPSTYNFGNVVESSTSSTGLTYFTVNNTSGAAVDITIHSANFTGGNGWIISDTASPGSDVAGLKAGLSGQSYNVTVRNSPTYFTLIYSMTDQSNQQWGLQLLAPTSFSDGVVKNANVTLTATLS